MHPMYIIVGVPAEKTAQRLQNEGHVHANSIFLNAMVLVRTVLHSKIKVAMYISASRKADGATE